MPRLPFLARRRPGDLVIGKNAHHPLYKCHIPERARSRHCYIIGNTGTGKSKLLEHMLLQDFASGRGVLLIDPHSDLIRDLLKSILSDPQLATRAQERIIYFNPMRDDYVIPMNVLNMPSAKSSYTAAQTVIEAFRRTWPGSLKTAPRFEDIALNSLICLIENGLTLVHMRRLLRDKHFRGRLLQRVTNPEVVDFFRHEFSAFGRDRAAWTESTRNKISAFTTNPHFRVTLGQPDNRLVLRELMDRGAYVLIDLGDCRGVAEKLMGSLLATLLEEDAMSRKDIPPEQRRPFYAYIDEFTSFSADQDDEGHNRSLTTILSECRKFGLSLTLAHQNLSQITPRMLGAIGQTRTKIVFGIEYQDAEYFAKRLTRVDMEAIKHAAQTDTQHPLFKTVFEQLREMADQLTEPPDRHAIVKGHDRSVKQIKTITIPRYKASDDDVDRFLKESLAANGIPFADARRVVDRSLREPADEYTSDPDAWH